MDFFHIIREKIFNPICNSPKKNFNANDVVLVSYPKSGNTWVRFFMANLQFPEKRPIHFMNVINFVPELFGNEIIETTNPTTQLNLTVFKSHERFTPGYPKVIYLLRDGRDVYVSYYYYLMHNLPKNTTFANFLENKKFYPLHWKDHCESWLFNNYHKNILLVRYEDLKRKPLNEFEKIAVFAGLSPTKKELEESINWCSFKTMKELEIKYGRPFKKKQIAQEANQFVRKGLVGDWKEHFSDQEKKVFKQINGEMLIRLGYEHNNNW